MNPLVGVERPRLRGVEHPVRDAHRQVAEGLLADPRPGGVVEGLGRRQDVDLHAAREPEVVRRPAADRRGRRLHDQSGQEGGVAELHLRRWRTSPRRRTDDRTLVVTSSVADPKLPTMDIYILPKHIWEKQDAKAITKYAALDGVGSGPFTLEHLEKGQFARFKANPYYYGGKPADRRASCCATSTTPTRWSPRSSAGEIDAAEDVPGTAFHQLEKDPNIVTVQGNQGAMERVRDQRRRGPEEAAPGAARSARAPGDRPRDRQEDDRQPRARRPRHAGRAAERLAEPGVGARDPRRPAATTSISTRRTRSSTRRATRTPTATASARCPAAGAR